ncbi:unnamed protein product, partial [Effrenium voratum]
ATHKREWDQFCRSACARNFPMSLAPMYQSSKLDLFSLWLDGSKDWKKVTYEVERTVQSRNLNRKQWQAQKGRTILQDYGDAKGTKILEARKAAGLWYPDPDFPEDSEEAWYYMASGHQVRREDETGEAARLKGAVKCDGDMLNALTQEGSALAKGAMPAVHAATETGKKKLLEGMADAAVKVAKTKKKTDDKPKSEQVLPKTMTQLASDRLPTILSESTSAREKSIALHHVDYASELSKGLLRHAQELESLYRMMSKALLEGMSDDSFYQNLFKSLDEKKQWYEKAKADLKARKQMHRFTRYYRCTQLCSAAGNTGYLDRLYLPRRKLTLANLHTWGNEDYAELGSKFKAAHVKIMLWWLAKKTQIITDESDGE